MSDCRFGVSPVNYPDPDPDSESITALLDIFNARNIDYKVFNFDYGISLHIFGPLSHDL